MKPAIATITLFFFLFTFSTTKSSPLKAATLEAVVDISGEKVKAGVSYYVLSAFKGTGGGLSFNTFGNDTCPNVVVQEWIELSKGKPVQFFPLNPKNNHVVRSSRNLNIKFSELISTCVESGVWKITKFISESRNVAANNGVVGNQDIFNWFKIEKAEFEGVYKIMFCPNPPSSAVCQDLGIFSVGDNDKRYTGLANPGEFQPLRVVFQKAFVDNAINDDDAVIMSSYMRSWTKFVLSSLRI